MLPPQKRAQFERLFEEFAQTYPQTPNGQRHIVGYAAMRQVARENWATVQSMADRGEDITDAVLLKLLPYTDSRNNREKGAWIHLAPTITGDIKKWYENSDWTDPEDWPKIAQAILDFVRRCLADPSQLSDACRAFDQLPYSKGFQSGTLSPILNALRPGDFMLVNNKSRDAINYFTGSAIGQPLLEYAEANRLGHQLVAALADQLVLEAAPDLSPADTFDMFTHWLRAVKNFYDSAEPPLETSLLPRQLAAPFNTIFAGREEAEAIFDFLKESMPYFGATGPDDNRFAMTLPSNHYPHVLRLNFGNWLVVSVKGRGDSEEMTITLALLKEQLPQEYRQFVVGNEFSQTNFTHAVRGMEVILVTIPASLFFEMEESLIPLWRDSAQYIGQLFQDWIRSPFLRAHKPPVFEAIFDPVKRDELLLNGLPAQDAQIEKPIDSPFPTYDQLMNPTIQALKALGGSGTIAEIYDKVAELMDFTIAQLELLHNPEQGSQTEIEYRLAWSRTYLKKYGLLENPSRGVWALTELGQQIERVDEDKVKQYVLDDYKQQNGQRIEPPIHIEVEPDEDDGEPEPTPYSHEDFLAETYLTVEKARELWEMLRDKKQIIFYGPPGTGKSYVAQRLACWLTNQSKPSPERVEMVQFHPAYGYEDFIEGIRPESIKTEDGRYAVTYPTRPGLFVRFCRKAALAPADRPHVFIIDEINRGNIPRIFGELMLLLEYRDRNVPLPYSGDRFTIPANVYLIGTMNTADRSIALVDFALRRRFHFAHFGADPGIFDRWLADHDVDLPYLSDLYRHLAKEAIDDANFAIGPSYFMTPDLSEGKLKRIWRYSVEPYLEEYYVDQPDKVAPWRWDGERVRSIRGEA